jgi:hypothetical protein
VSADHRDSSRLGRAGIDKVGALPAAEHQHAVLEVDDPDERFGKRIGQRSLSRCSGHPAHPLDTHLHILA